MVENKLEIKTQKCKFLSEEEYLGYQISEQGVQRNSERGVLNKETTKKGIEAVMNFGIPENVHEEQRFIGL